MKDTPIFEQYILEVQIAVVTGIESWYSSSKKYLTEFTLTSDLKCYNKSCLQHLLINELYSLHKKYIFNVILFF